ncbi:MAG: hypothetical protein K0R29_2177 [Pseudobdellovibrio sp.]|nr:hypothetical protein [Pseudobdellovibrio sp.]
MKSVFPSGYEANEIIRYQFRANHIYILMVGLLNLLGALVVSHTCRNWRYFTGLFGNILVAVAPLLLIIAFFTEPVRAIPQRPLTLFGAIACGAGVVALFISHITKDTFSYRRG